MSRVGEMMDRIDRADRTDRTDQTDQTDQTDKRDKTTKDQPLRPTLAWFAGRMEQNLLSEDGDYYGAWETEAQVVLLDWLQDATEDAHQLVTAWIQLGHTEFMGGAIAKLVDLAVLAMQLASTLHPEHGSRRRGW